ncbi:hypothetical protein I4U23_017749 [Adineta vaga]|nr:hypothetical protein I4U23_017749 [Adineta vaga]
MNRSNVYLLDLPDEILLMILKNLNNVDVLYSLLDINNGRLDTLVQENTFTNILKFDSIDDISFINRFCIDILPRIYDHIKSFTLHPFFMERILLANKYPNLTQLRIIHFQQDFVSKHFTNFFKNLKNLNVLEPSLQSYPPLSLRQLSSTTFSLQFLHIYDCFLLLDGRLKQLTKLSVTVHFMDDFSTTIHEPDILPNLKFFSLQSSYEFQQYNRIILLLRRMLFVEKLTLYLCLKNQNKYIDGASIQHDILDNMPQLQSFTFYIVSSVDMPDLFGKISREDIEKTLTNLRQPTTSMITHTVFGTDVCSIFSLPFEFKCLSDIDNGFPNMIFNNVTSLLVQDVIAFKHEFFIRIARSFPLLKSLSIINFKPQSSYNIDTGTRDKNESNSIIEYPYLTALDTRYAHKHYLEQFLNGTKAFVPCLIELSVESRQLKTVTMDFRRLDIQRTCAKIKRLFLSGSLEHSDEFSIYFSSLNVE